MKLCHSDGGMSHQEIRIAEKKQGDKPFIGKESFPCILYTMLEEVESHGLAHIVSWQPHGRWAFIEHVLPVYCRMSKFPSFQRQLNLYGFQRITTGRDKGGYYHELFLRGRKDLSKTIPRQQVKGAGPRKPAMPDAEPNFYLMDFMPAGGSDAPGSNPPAAPLSGLMMPSAASAANETQPSLESGWMASLYPSIFMASSSAAGSSVALTNALQQQQHPQHGMMAPSGGAMGHGNFGSLVAALGGGAAASQYGFMGPAANMLPSPPVANRMANFGGDSSLFSLLNPGALPLVPSYDQSNVADLMRRDIATANLRNAAAPGYGQQERETGNLLLDAYAAALQSEFSEPSGMGAFTARRRPSSGEDSFRDFISRNSSA